LGLGFIFVGTSRRAVSRKACSEILRAVPHTVLTVGVVANEDPVFLKDLLRVCPLGALQFHGEETPEEVLSFKGQAKLIKAIRVQDAGSLAQIPKYKGVDAVLLDTYLEDQPGGTGVSFDWSLAVQAKTYEIPLILSTMGVVLIAETLRFPGTVLLIHGDTHRHRVDQPLMHPDQRARIPSFTRVEVFGSPTQNWVRIRVVPEDGKVRFEVAPGS